LPVEQHDVAVVELAFHDGADLEALCDFVGVLVRDLDAPSVRRMT